MDLRQIAFAAALGLFATAVSAQVTLYGIVDTGVEVLNHVNGDTLTRVPTFTGGQYPSRWGLRGAENLGGGLSAVFTLESGFAMDTGASLQNGRLFGRQAFLGLSGNWGTLTLGRHWTMTFYSLLDADVIGAAVFSMASLDSYIPNARSDNSILYRGTFSGLTIGGTYTFGRDVLAAGNCPGENASGSRKACTGWSALLKYDGTYWGFAAAYDIFHGGAGATPIIVIPSSSPAPPGTTTVAFTSPDDDDGRTFLNGYFKFGSLKIGGGWIGRKISTAAGDVESDLYYLGLNYPFTSAFSLDAQLLGIRHDDRDADADMLVLRGNYNFSRSTGVYATAGYVDNKGTLSYSVSGSTLLPASPAPAQSQTGVMLGVRHFF
jgi:predicted porin